MQNSMWMDGGCIDLVMKVDDSYGAGIGKKFNTA